MNGTWRWKEAEQDFRRAIALDPKYAAAHQWYGEELMVEHRTADAVEQLRTVPVDEYERYGVLFG